MTQTPAEYQPFLENLKKHIQSRQVQAMLSANSQMLYLYWELGHFILQQQNKQSWGTKVINQLASDLRTAFPDLKGLSSRNLQYMRQFAHDYNARAIAQQVVAQFKNGESTIVQQPAAQLEDIDDENVIISYDVFIKHLIAKLP